MNKKILVVIDMQNDFIDGSLGTLEAQAIVDKVVDKIQNWNGPVIATQDTHDSKYLNTQEGKKLPIEHCIKDTSGWNIESNVLKALKEHKYYLASIRKDTFGEITLAYLMDKALCDLFDNLDMYYHTYNGFDIELIGICTDICVIANAIILKSFCPESKITVDASCCAGTTPESHKRALECMKVLQIDIINEDV